MFLLVAGVGIAAEAAAVDAPENAESHKWLTGLHAQLTEMGLKPGESNVASAGVEAIVRTLDAGARIVSATEWLAIRERREGLHHLPGLRLSMTNGLPVVREVVSGSPAERQGIVAGDIIVGIDDRQISKIALQDAQQLLRSDREGNVTITYQRADATVTAIVSRALLREPAIELSELLPNHIGYIKLNGLYSGAGRDVVMRIRAWSETRGDGIILDLRGAGGFDAAAAAQIAGLYSRGGQFLFAYRDHHQQDIDVFKAPEGNPVTMPIMILIDRHTSGASEVLAAALNGVSKEALLIGETTAGDFALREAVEISGMLVYMTTRVLDTADGYRYNGQFGLAPGVLITDLERDTHDYEPEVDLLDRREKLEEEERDAATRRRVRGDGTLERAIDILVGLKSLNKAASKVSSPDMF